MQSPKISRYYHDIEKKYRDISRYKILAIPIPIIYRYTLQGMTESSQFSPNVYKLLKVIYKHSENVFIKCAMVQVTLCHATEIINFIIGDCSCTIFRLQNDLIFTEFL